MSSEVMHLDEHALLFIGAAEGLNCIAACLVAAERGIASLDRDVLLREAGKIRQYVVDPVARQQDGLKKVDALDRAIRGNAELSELKERLRTLVESLGMDASGIP